VKASYISLKKMNLAIYGIKHKDLTDYATTEKDVKKAFSRKPLPIARLPEEDVDDLEQPEEDT